MSDSNPQTLRVGARGSQLAVAQANSVIELLLKANPDCQFELVSIKTTGDADRRTPLASVGSVGVFVKELQAALAEGKIDIAVHSAKDLPAKSPEEIMLAAVPERAAVEDVLICPSGEKLAEIPTGATLATGSPRRRAQITRVRPDLKFCGVRGNVDTRLKKLARGEFFGLILARAGLQRLGMEDKITEILPAEKFLPAPGQGALALEIRTGDELTEKIVSKIDSKLHHATVTAERSLTRTLQAGCLVPIGAWARRTEKNELKMNAVILDKEGKICLAAEGKTGRLSQAEQLGEKLAHSLLQQGAEELLKP